jgi:hypothetical protein
VKTPGEGGKWEDRRQRSAGPEMVRCSGDVKANFA